MMESLSPIGDPLSRTTFRLVTQMWEQNPLILLMVAGLILFGLYAIYESVRESRADSTYLPDHAGNAHIWNEGPDGSLR
jgi:hypothetical protein